MGNRLILVCTALLAATGSGYAGTISLANPNFDDDITGSFLLNSLDRMVAQHGGVWRVQHHGPTRHATGPGADVRLKRAVP